MIKSVVLYTEEIDDLEISARELLSRAQGFEFGKNSMAILYMDVDTDYPELYGLLKEEWDFPVVGVTDIGLLTGAKGFCRSGIAAMLLTSDDCRFAVGMTKGLSLDNYMEHIRGILEELEEELGGEEVKLVLTFGGKVKEMSGDDIVNAVDALGKKVTIYGAFASDMFSYLDYMVGFNDRYEMQEQVFILISGDLKPKSLCVQSLSGKANFSYEVTSSKGNLVYRLGNGTFLEALEKSGLSSEKEIVAGEFTQTPFVTILKKPGGMRVEALRNLTRLDHRDGSGLFVGGIEEGSSLELGLLNREDVKITVKKAFDEVFEWLKTEGRDCGTILCCSCTSRLVVLGNDGTLEGESYLGRLPDGVSLLGMYSYGEFCPVGDMEGEWYNLFHNSTFTILGF